jgi:hypothetical protein
VFYWRERHKRSKSNYASLSRASSRAKVIHPSIHGSSALNQLKAPRRLCECGWVRVLQNIALDISFHKSHFGRCEMSSVMNLSRNTKGEIWSSARAARGGWWWENTTLTRTHCTPSAYVLICACFAPCNGINGDIAFCSHHDMAQTAINVVQTALSHTWVASFVFSNQSFLGINITKNPKCLHNFCVYCYKSSAYILNVQKIINLDKLLSNLQIEIN